MSTLPTVACLMPTYGRPKLVANSLACFIAQDYPADSCCLFILDDLGQFTLPVLPFYNPGGGDLFASVHLESTPARYPSLPAKYTRLLQLCQGFDVVCVWDDDDVYLPNHISANISAMQRWATNLLEARIWSHPTHVWTDYVHPGRPGLWADGAAGRFHGSVCATRALVDHVGGWPQTLRGDFDQQFISLLSKEVPPVRPEWTYVFRWGTTGAHHCQGLMKGQACEEWYEKVHVEDSNPYVLRAEFDPCTISYLHHFGWTVGEDGRVYRQSKAVLSP